MLKWTSIEIECENHLEGEENETRIEEMRWYAEGWGRYNESGSAIKKRKLEERRCAGERFRTDTSHLSKSNYIAFASRQQSNDGAHFVLCMAKYTFPSYEFCDKHCTQIQFA